MRILQKLFAYPISLTAKNQQQETAAKTEIDKLKVNIFENLVKKYKQSLLKFRSLPQFYTLSGVRLTKKFNFR